LSNFIILVKNQFGYNVKPLVQIIVKQFVIITFTTKWIIHHTICVETL